MMKMLRHYFVSDDLDDLELLEQQLEADGVATAQIRVLSNNDSEVSNHSHLAPVNSLLKTDALHYGEIGALVGFFAALLILGSAYAMGPDSGVGWVPYVFLAVVAFGFCTWEGGLIGLDKLNYHFQRFESVLDEGKHVIMLDLNSEQTARLGGYLKDHPSLYAEGTESGSQNWLLSARHGLFEFIDRNLFSFSQVRSS